MLDWFIAWFLLLYIFYGLYCNLMPRSHIYVKARPVRATQDNLRDIEWDVAISW